MGRTGRLGLIAVLAISCGTAEGSDDSCEDATAAHRIDAPDVCLAAYAATRDPADAGRAALELARHPGHEARVAALAQEIGDKLGGADGWNAQGGVFYARGDYRPAIAAYRRAFAHRAAGDQLGRRRDAMGLFRSYFQIEDYRNAMHFAATAYQLSSLREDPETRASVLAGVAALLYDLGDLPACEAVMAEADAVVDLSHRPSPSFTAIVERAMDERTRVWIRLRELHGIVDLAHKRYQLAEAELSEALGVARDDHLDDWSLEAANILISADLKGGDIEAAAAVLAAAPPVPRSDAPDSGVSTAATVALVALARGRNQEAIDITTKAAGNMTADITHTLDALRGRALARLHRSVDAEAALLRSISAYELQADDLDLDVLKGWLIDERRDSFEDLFLLYVGQRRVADALAVVQRATARAVLDGLTPHDTPGAQRIGDAIEQAGDRADGLRALVHALRNSPPASRLAGPALLERLGARNVLTYFRANDELWLIAVVAGAEPRARSVGKVADLDQRARAWLAAPARDELADDLGARLLPRDLLPPPGRTIYIAIDDPIRDVSFAGLRVDGQFLVQRNAIAYAPSAAVIAAQASLPVRRGAPVVIGDPSGDLPSARREASEVAATIGSTARVGTSATRSVVLEGAGAALLHIAAHTRETPDGPALVLADGTISASDVLEHQIAARVVVLTSCVSADPGDRDQLRPVASAFLAAGAGAVVASRWVVDDALALRFAHAFYVAGGEVDPVGATAIAQQQLAAEGVGVASWGTFVVLGGGASPVIRKETTQ